MVYYTFKCQGDGLIHLYLRAITLKHLAGTGCFRLHQRDTWGCCGPQFPPEAYAQHTRPHFEIS